LEVVGVTRIAAIDPGESAGLAVFDGPELLDAVTLDGWDVVGLLAKARKVESQLVVRGPLTEAADVVVNGLPDISRIVCEDWAIYPESLGAGRVPDWDKCRTARMIGAIELIARLSACPLTLQPAAIKSDALRAHAEHLFSTPLHDARHQNDAVMHGWYWLARNKELQR
jgi:hypothetical protein